MSSFTPYEKANTLCISVLQNQSVSRSVSGNKDRGFGRGLQLQSVRICLGVSVRVAHRLQAAGMWCAVPVSEALILVVNLLINNQKL